MKNFGGARRNRTADNGFADHCLTTWRPRHRTEKLSVFSDQLSVRKENALMLLCCRCQLFLPQRKALVIRVLRLPGAQHPDRVGTSAVPLQTCAARRKG